ncbi:hypothetical protein ABVT39_010702 [Epinephelus coioides]
MKLVVYFTLLTSAVHAVVLRKRQSCPQVCDTSQCPAPPQACYYGQVKDGCSCCVVCAAGEGDACGDLSGGGLSCGDGLLCESVPGKLDGIHSSCVCASFGLMAGLTPASAV